MPLIKQSNTNNSDKVDSLEEFLVITNLFQKLASPVGLNVLQENFRVNPRAVLCVLFGAIAILILLTSLVFMDKDMSKLMECACVTPVPFQVMNRYLLVLVFSKEIRVMYTILLKLHKASTGKQNETLKLWTSRAKRLMLVQCGLIGSINLVQMVFAVVYLLLGEKRLIWSMELPLIDVTQGYGFNIALAFELFGCFLCGGISIFLDILFLLYCFSGAAYIEFIKIECESLQEFILKSHNKIDHAVITKKLNNIIELEQNVKV